MKHSIFNYINREINGQTLLFNTAKETLVELDQKTLDQYERNDLDSDTQAAMADLGFLIADDVDELASLEFKWKNNFTSSKKLELTVMVTDACNFRCPYCYQAHSTHNMGIEETNRLCRYLMKSIDNGVEVINIHWFGGEPLLNTAPIFYIEHFLKEKGIKGSSNVTTNGYLLTDELLHRFREETRIHAFQITLDGTENLHNKTRRHVSGEPTYKRICSNIVSATQNSFFVIIRLNMTKENQNLDAFLAEINALGLPRSRYFIHITNAHEFTNSEKLSNFYFNTAEEYSIAYDRAQDSFTKAHYKFPRNVTRTAGCSFESGNTFLVGTDLKLYFCSSCECTDEFEQGYIDESGQIHLNEHYRNRINASPFADDECRNCVVLPLCMGGCTYCRLRQKKFCIPERYFLDKYIHKLYTEALSQKEAAHP